jgi:CO/xanthine dehydrogenase FAD-binding subunit
MKSAPFEYVRAHSVEEACATLDDEAMIIAGGQTLVPLMAMRLARPTLLVDINDVKELRGILAKNGAVEIKACTRQAEALASPVVKSGVPLLAKALPFVGHIQTRNRGTVGGSIALGDPSAEIPLVAVALGATIRLRNSKSSREIAASKFFTAAMQTARAPDECLESVSFPAWTGRVGIGFQEVAERQGDFAVVAACAQIERDAGGVCRRAAIAVGGASPTPRRVAEAEQILLGSKVGDAAIRQAAAQVGKVIDPSSDGHATAEYRRRVAPKLVARALAEALA